MTDAPAKYAKAAAEKNEGERPATGRLKDFRLQNVFCDRDGTIIHDRHYLSDPDGVELLPGAASGLGRMLAGGARLFVVTNQSGIGRGLFGLEEYQACHQRFEELLAERGIKLSGSAFCPHAPAGMETAKSGASCSCRKPGIGMWHELSSMHDLRPENSLMVGDKPEDVLFGKNAGFACSILVLTGKGEKSAAAMRLPELPAASSFLRLDETKGRAAGIEEDTPWPDCLARDLGGAADFLEFIGVLKRLP